MDLSSLRSLRLCGLRLLGLRLFGLLLVLALPSCDEGAPIDGGVDDGAVDAAPAVGPAAIVFEPGAIGASTGFFDFPFPSDLRTDDAGRADFTGFPRSRGLIAQAIELLASEGAGVSPITGVYFRFTGNLDETSLPADPADTLADDSPVVLIDVDPDSPDRGARLPAYVRFQSAPTLFWPSHTLVVRAVPGVHLHPGRRYAVALRDAIRASDGSAVAHDDDFEALKTSSDGALGAHYDALFGELEALGVARDDLLSASTFTVADPAREMDLAREFVDAQALPDVTGWRVLADAPAERSFEAIFETYELMEGEPPYMEFGSGRIAFDAAGAPLVVRRRAVRVGLTVPGGAPPPEGWPVVLYGHGTGGDHRTHIGDEGSSLAEIGVATLGFEAALHGDRNPGGLDVGTLLAANPIAARETVRQTVIDQMIVYRMLAAGRFTVPSGVSGGAEIPLSPASVLYMGHSQGSQEGGLLLGVEPSVEAAFLSAGGGGGIISIVEREITTGQPLSCLVASLINEPCAALTEDHPVILLLIQALLDPADPLSFAHRFHRERPDTWAPLHVAMTEGTEDTLTPPRTVEALAASIGLPIVEPVAQATDPYALLGRPTVAPPVSANLTLPSGERVTGGLMQFPGEGHYAIYRNADARRRFVEFFRTATESGVPTLVP